MLQLVPMTSGSPAVPQQVEATRLCGAGNSVAPGAPSLLLPSSSSPLWSCYIAPDSLLGKTDPCPAEGMGDWWERLPSW